MQKSPLDIHDTLAFNVKAARKLMILFGMLTLLILFSTWIAYIQLDTLRLSYDGEFIPDEEANNSFLLVGFFELIKFGLYGVCAILFLKWFRRSYASLEDLGATLTHRESMAVWSWFMPIIFLYRPLQIMREIWLQTQEKVKLYDLHYDFKNGGTLIGIWWSLFLGSAFVSKFILNRSFHTLPVDHTIEYCEAIFIINLLEIPFIISTLLIVYYVTTMQAKLAEEVGYTLVGCSSQEV